MNVQSEWSPLDWNNPESAKFAANNTNSSVYRRVLRFCIVTGALRVTDPLKWKQVEKLNAMMMYESVFKQMREARFFAARRERKRRRKELGYDDTTNNNNYNLSSSFASFLGVRETVLSVRGAITSMSRKRNPNEILERSCQIFGELSSIQPKDVLLVSKTSICEMSGMNFADSKRDFLKKKTSARESFVPKTAALIVLANNDKNNNGNSNSPRANTPRLPPPVKHSFFC